jgi:hypothetical protein
MLSSGRRRNNHAITAERGVRYRLYNTKKEKPHFWQRLPRSGAHFYRIRPLVRITNIPTGMFVMRHKESRAKCGDNHEHLIRSSII